MSNLCGEYFHYILFDKIIIKIIIKNNTLY